MKREGTNDTALAQAYQDTKGPSQPFMVQVESLGFAVVAATVVHAIHCFSDWWYPAVCSDPLVSCIAELAAAKRTTAPTTTSGLYFYLWSAIAICAVAAYPICVRVKRVTVEVITHENAAQTAEYKDDFCLVGEEVDEDLANYVPRRK